jgi:hypothetical protein
MRRLRASFDRRLSFCGLVVNASEPSPSKRVVPKWSQTSIFDRPGAQDPQYNSAQLLPDAILMHLYSVISSKVVRCSCSHVITTLGERLGANHISNKQDLIPLHCPLPVRGVSLHP